MKLRKLLIPPGVVLLFLLSWLFSPTRAYWDFLDHHAFYALNGWVQESVFWQNVWAFMGTRSMDGIYDGLMLFSLIYYIKKGKRIDRKRRVAELIFVALLIFLTLYTVNQILFSKCLHLCRASPTITCANPFRLSYVIKWTAVKDQSYTSFPGDHATTAFLFASIIYHLMGWRAGTLATFYAVIFSLPRLVAGAHWLTDVLLGSSMIALSVSSLAFGTPIANCCIHLIQSIFSVFIGKKHQGRKNLQTKPEGGGTRGRN